MSESPIEAASTKTGPAWWFIGPWVLDAYTNPETQAPIVTVVARDANTGVPRCGWRLEEPAVELDADEARAASLMTPVEVPVTGILIALFEGLGVNPADLLAALVADKHLHPETLAAVAPISLLPWTAYTHGVAKGEATRETTEEWGALYPGNTTPEGVHSEDSQSDGQGADRSA